MSKFFGFILSYILASKASSGNYYIRQNVFPRTPIIQRYTQSQLLSLCRSRDPVTGGQLDGRLFFSGNLPGACLHSENENTITTTILDHICTLRALGSLLEA